MTNNFTLQINDYQLKTINKYYSHRANEYETIYERDDPVRQNEQFLIHTELKQIFANKSVLEIACGTGYWTETISEVAHNVVAVDYSLEVIEVAKSKNIIAEFIIDDAFSLNRVEKCSMPDVLTSGFLIFQRTKLKTSIKPSTEN